MKKIFYLPISVFLFGLMLILIRYLAPQLPIWLGEAGKLIVLFEQLFFPWQTWGLMVAAYLLAGILYCRGDRDFWLYIVYTSWLIVFLWAIGWPIIIAINEIYKIFERGKYRRK